MSCLHLQSRLRRHGARSFGARPLGEHAKAARKECARQQRVRHRGAQMASVVLVCLAGIFNFGAVGVSRGVAQRSAPREQNEARSLYDAGAVAFSDGRFETALSRWEESYELSERPELLFNIGTAHDRLGHDSEAVQYYRRFLQEVPDATNRNYVERRVAVLEAREPEAEEEPGASSENAVEPAEVEHGDPESGAPEAVAPSESGATIEGNAAQDSDAGDAGDAVDVATDDGGGLPLGAVITTVAGGAMLLAGATTALISNSRYSDLESRCPSGLCPEDAQGDIDGLRRINRSTDVLLVVGGVAAAAGVIWWIAAGPDDDAETQVGLGPGGLSVRGRF